MELDFEKELNTDNRNQMVLPEVAHITEDPNLRWWLYHLLTELITSSADEITNAAGTQQGCPLPSLPSH